MAAFCFAYLVDNYGQLSSDKVLTLLNRYDTINIMSELNGGLAHNEMVRWWHRARKASG